MAMYFVRWFDPKRPRPLVKDFHTKKRADDFRKDLPLLSEPPQRYANQ